MQRGSLLLLPIFLVFIGLITAGYFLYKNQPSNEKKAPQNKLSVTQSPPSTTPSPQLPVKEVSKDPFGYEALAMKNNAQDMIKAGSKIISIAQPETFAVVWLPTNMKPERMLVMLHGTGGIAYDMMANQLGKAQENNYGIISLQWWKKDTNTYFTASQIYSSAISVLNFVKQTYSLDPKVVVLQGFSRGGAISYEVTALDQAGENIFDATAAMSGGIPTDSKLEPKSSDKQDSFFVKINSGKVDNDLYKGHHFFLWCGMKDEQWGTTMCDKTTNAENLIKKYGGIVDLDIQDADGTHGGWVLNPDNYSQFVNWFLKL